MKHAKLLEQIRKDFNIPMQPIRLKQTLRCTHKWGLFRNKVDFKGKSVLDIGYCEGYSTLEAIEEGAIRAVGVDRDPRYIDTALELVKRVDIPEAEFVLSEWSEFKSDEKFDIVLCLGFIHHIVSGHYEEQFDRVCGFSNDVVVLELRLNSKPSPELEVWQKPGSLQNNLTKASYGWLETKFDKLGFDIISRDFVVQGEREVWVVKRR